MDLLYAAILGVIEGVTEFLPISSTAHLLVTEKLVGFSDEAEVFTVVIQLGAVLAAALLFKDVTWRMLAGAWRGGRDERRFFISVALGLLPAAVVGLAVEMTVGLPDSLLLITWTLIVGGIVLWAIERWIDTKPLDKESDVNYASISPLKALAIGCAQCLAIIPGVSRSGATIGGGLLMGVNRPTATSFSFFLSIPIIAAASVLKLANHYDKIGSISGGWLSVAIGSVVSFITAFIVVKWLLGYVKSNDFKPFAYYRIVVGVLILVVAYLIK